MNRRVRAVLFAAAGLLAALAPARGAELLKNPGFETIAGGVPAGWRRECNEKLSGRFAVVPGAFEGKNAVMMETEEWGFLRPQFLTQEVSLPPGAGVCRLAVRARGQGLVNLALQFRKGGAPLKTVERDLGFGPTPMPEESLNAFGLEEEYQPYEVSVEVPPAADTVLVKLGNSCGLFDRLNVWGRVFLDDASLSVAASAIPPRLPSHPTAGEAAVPPGTVDVAPYAHIAAQPASFMPQALVDGDIRFPWNVSHIGRPFHMGGLDRAGSLSFRFNAPLVLKAVMLYLTGTADTLSLRGDADGDGRFEALLARAERLRGPGWTTIGVEGRPVRALRVQAVGGRALCDYRTTYAFATEAKLLAAAGSVDLAALGKNRVFGLVPAMRRGVPEFSLKPAAVEVPRRTGPKRFRTMVCADLWMWGVAANKKETPLADLSKSATFRQTVKSVKEMGVDTVLVDLTNSSVWNLMPWPSAVANGTRENHLKALIAALHAEGLQVIVEFIHNISPFETVKWHYPQEETSRYPGMKQYPSSVHGAYFRDNWLAILDEIMACGADGVGVSSDEHYYKGHFMETFPADDPGRAVYRKRFGAELPGKEEDTLAFRRWIVVRHEGIGDLFGGWTAALRKKYPGLYTNTMLMHWAHAYSFLTETGIPVDVIGSRGAIGELGSDYMGPYGVRMAAAANGWRKATMLYAGNLGSAEPDIHYYATTLWNWMYGGGSVNYWRLNWILSGPKADGVGASREAVTKAYRMSADLEALGAWEARPPRKIALLSSRASIDWWQVKSWWGMGGDLSWDRGLEGQRGWFADETAFNILRENGRAFDWFFLDQDDRLPDLGEYAVLVAPFARSVSRRAAEAVRSAVSRGSTLILLDGRTGETDEWGEPYPAPVFKDLADAGKAVVMGEDILAWGPTDAFAGRLLAAVDGRLGAQNPLRTERYGAKIDATLLERPSGEKFLFLVNWEERPATVDLSVAAPDGTYEMLGRDEDGWYAAGPGKRTAVSAKDLRSFRLTLAPRKAFFFVIRGRR